MCVCVLVNGPYCCKVNKQDKGATTERLVCENSALTFPFARLIIDSPHLVNRNISGDTMTALLQQSLLMAPALIRMLSVKRAGYVCLCLGKQYENRLKLSVWNKKINRSAVWVTVYMASVSTSWSECHIMRVSCYTRYVQYSAPSRQKVRESDR